MQQSVKLVYPIFKMTVNRRTIVGVRHDFELTGSRDSMVQRNGVAKAMETTMTREGMRGRIFGTRMECEAL